MVSGEQVGRHGMWPWLLQRVSAILLIWFAGIHFLAVHYDPDYKFVGWAAVTNRYAGRVGGLVGLAGFGFDVLLLAVVLFHALNGIRGILFDYVASPFARRMITYVITLLGLGLLAVGIPPLMAFAGAARTL